MTEEETIGFDAKEKPPGVIGQSFKEVNEDDGFAEDDWCEPRGSYSLRYYYSEDDVQYILKKWAEKWGAMAEKEIIDLMGDSD